MSSPGNQVIDRDDESLEGEVSSPVRKEAVHHPNHYGGDTTYETIKVLKAWLSHAEYVGFLKGNVIKYLSRAGKKDRTNEDYAKATWYQNELDRFLKENAG